MHILDYLKNAESRIRVDKDNAVQFSESPDRESAQVEYRLICSGAFYPAQFLGDWSRSNVARILLSLPFELLVASRPFDDYPQELVLRFAVSPIKESNGKVFHSYYPDFEIASDVAAILTLLCRRLITVSGKLREKYDSPHVPAILADYPIPVALQMRVSHWPKRPMHFLYGLDGIKVKSYHPPMVAFDSNQLMQILLTLPKLKMASAVIRSARLYASAMERIEAQPDICYQLFISAAETMADAVLEEWEPDNNVKIASKSGLVTYATETEKLSIEVAKRLALAVSKGNPWSSRKFRKFIMDNIDTSEVCREDNLFVVPQELCPKEAEIGKAIGEVYQARSGATHSGHSYPASAAIGPSVMMPVKAFDCVFNQQQPFPPIGWFERVVNNAVCTYIRSEVRQLSNIPQKATVEEDKESDIVDSDQHYDH